MRNLKTLAFAGLVGVLGFAGDASACHKSKCACPTTTTVVCAAPAPVATCAPAKKCHSFKMPKMGCHKQKATCAPVAYAAPATYAAPAAYASPQASAQASGQGM